MKNFFSTYSGRIDEVLLSHKKVNKKEGNLLTYRQKHESKFLFDSPSMFKDGSDLISDKEINKNIMNIDDSLSDVPVRDIQQNFDDQDLSHNLSMEESEQLLDNLGMLSPLMSKFQDKNDDKFSSSKIDTPSFKSDHIKRQPKFNRRKTNIRSAINFNDINLNIPMIELGNIPEVLDESNFYSEPTYKNPLNKRSNSDNTTTQKEESKWGQTDSLKSSTGTKPNDSPEKPFDRLQKHF